MFVDASALVAIIAQEPGYEALPDAMETVDVPLISGVAILEAVLALRRMSSGTVAEAEQFVRDALASAHAAEIAITSNVTRVAIEAYARYGKGQGHPARLNMGDCFAYACAHTYGVPLLFVGNDFAQTDIRSAMA